jgi:AraC-like DNA-binding protein
VERVPVQRFSLRSNDVEQVRAFGGEHFAPRRFLRPLGRSGRLAACFHLLRLGPVTICDARYGADVTLGYDGPGAYQVGVPLSGHLQARQGGRSLIGEGRRAVVSQPEEDVVIDRWSADCRQAVVKMEQNYLEDQLEGHLGSPVRPLRLAGGMDIGAGLGLSWAAMVRLTTAEFGTVSGMLDQPLIVARLIDTLTVGLLLAADHPYRELLAQPGPAYRSPPVRRAVEAIQACPEKPYTAIELARLAGVSVRTLQAGFQRYLGRTPMGYLRDVRLVRVHDELRLSDPSMTTVTAVAHRWGFFHLGRFAAAYRARYHTTPSGTLQHHQTSARP